MKKLLLTGFEPFLDFPVNPTMQVVEQLDGRTIGEYTICGKILPVDFSRSAKTLVAHIEREAPDAVLSLGLAGGRSKMTPERVALNVKDGEPDNAGNRPVDEPIEPAGPPAYFSTLPIRAMADRLNQESLPAEISNTAGLYLCNNVMYAGLHWAACHKPDMPSGFLHIPASFELAVRHGKIPGWPLKELVRGVTACIEVMTEPHHQ